MLKVTNILILLFLISDYVTNAQNTQIDSLENLLQKYTNGDTLRVNLLIESAYKLVLKDLDKCLSYAQEAEEIADKQNYAKGKAESSRLIGIYFHYKSDYPKALDYYKKSLEINEEIGNKRGISGCLNNIGSIYKTQGAHEKAIEFYKKSLKIYKELDYKSGISATLNNLGIIYRKEGNYPKALESYQKALRIYEVDKNKQGIAMSLNNIAVIHRYQKNYVQALEYNHKSLRIKEELDDKIGISASYANIGAIHFYQGNFSESLEYYQKSLSLKEELDEQRGISICLSSIGQIYFKQANYPIALEYLQKSINICQEIGYESGLCEAYLWISEVYAKKMSYNEALKYAIESLKIANRLKLLNEQSKIYEQLSFIYASTKDYKKAYENHLLHKELNDSTFSEENIKKITGLEYKYEFDKEKQAIELKQQRKDIIRIEESKRQTIMRNSFIAGFLLMSLMVILVLQGFLQKRKANSILAKQKEEIENQAEELKTTNKKLIELDEFKQGMTGMIVHDLKNPLNGIINISNSFSVQKQNIRMKLISKQILNMVLNILDVYKYEDTKMIVDKSDYSLFEISQNSINKVDFLAEQKNIEIDNQILVNTGIKADQEIIERVFVNILTNAVKHSPGNGSIQVTSLIEQQGCIKISVSDNGHGIQKDQLNKVFDKFGQVSAKKSGSVRSTGLGLTFCKIAVEAHGGEIGVESEINNGTIFWFTLQTSKSEFKKTKQAKLKSHSQSSSISLNTEDIKYLEPFVLQIQELEIYDISMLRNILKQIDSNQNERINCWKEDMNHAIRTGSEDRYRIVLSEAIIN